MNVFNLIRVSVLSLVVLTGLASGGSRANFIAPAVLGRKELRLELRWMLVSIPGDPLEKWWELSALESRMNSSRAVFPGGTVVHVAPIAAKAV